MPAGRAQLPGSDTETFPTAPPTHTRGGGSGAGGSGAEPGLRKRRGCVCVWGERRCLPQPRAAGSGGDRPAAEAARGRGTRRHKPAGLGGEGKKGSALPPGTAARPPHLRAAARGRGRRRRLPAALALAPAPSRGAAAAAAAASSARCLRSARRHDVTAASKQAAEPRDTGSSPCGPAPSPRGSQSPRSPPPHVGDSPPPCPTLPQAPPRAAESPLGCRQSGRLGPSRPRPSMHRAAPLRRGACREV